jgi:hypothetical protein
VTPFFIPHIQILDLANAASQRWFDLCFGERILLQEKTYSSSRYL